MNVLYRVRRNDNPTKIFNLQSDSHGSFVLNTNNYVWLDAIVSFKLKDAFLVFEKLMCHIYKLK